MAEPDADATAGQRVFEPSNAAGFTRADAVASRRRILQAAATQRVTAGSAWPRSPPRRESAAPRCIATSQRAGAQRSAHRGRSTRTPVGASERIAARQKIGQVTTMPYQAAGHLGRDQPLALEVTRVLDEVPPHLVPDQLVAEARRAGGVAGRPLCRRHRRIPSAAPGRFARISRTHRRAARARAGDRARRPPGLLRAAPAASFPAASPSRCGCAAASPASCSASALRSPR